MFSSFHDEIVDLPLAGDGLAFFAGFATGDLISIDIDLRSSFEFIQNAKYQRMLGYCRAHVAHALFNRFATLVNRFAKIATKNDV